MLSFTNIMLTNYFIYSKIFIFQGSSFLSPAHGCGGARATMNFNNSPSAKKSGEARKQAGKKEGGWGEGIFARLPKRSPAALLVKSRTPKKSFVFLLLGVRHLTQRMGIIHSYAQHQNVSSSHEPRA